MKLKSNRVTIAVSTAILLLSGIANSHPHMFIDAMAKVMCSDSALSGIYIYWDFDDMNSAVLIEDYDKNKNRRFEKGEYNDIEVNSFSYCSKSDYFTVLTWDNHYHPIEKVENFVAKVVAEGRVQYSFFIPLNIPIEKVVGKKIKLFFEDPSMFIAFTLKKNLIQVNTHEAITGTIGFGKVDHLECAIVTIKRK